PISRGPCWIGGSAELAPVGGRHRTADGSVTIPTTEQRSAFAVGEFYLDLVPATLGSGPKDDFIVALESPLHSLSSPTGKVVRRMVEAACPKRERRQAFQQQSLSVAFPIAHVQGKDGSVSFAEGVDDRCVSNAPSLRRSGCGPTKEEYRLRSRQVLKRG